MTTLIENRGWTHKEALAFKEEVERLRYPGPDVSTSEALINQANDFPKALHNIEKMNADRHKENELRRQNHLRRIELENRNLEWPQPDKSFIIRKSEDYWKNGCIYCGYKSKTTHDYEVHIVINHPGKPGYPGPADNDVNRL